MTDGLDEEDRRSTRRQPMRRHPAERLDQGGAANRSNAPSRDPRVGDSVRSKILYGGAVALAAAILVALGLAALFDLSFWAALGIAALMGLGLAMLLAVLVG